jgi:hypothetical protein
MAETEVPEGEASETPDVIEDNKSANTIASMLWVWKWVNRERLKYETNEDSIFIKFPEKSGLGTKFMGGFLETSGEDISNTILTYRYFYLDQYGNKMADTPDANADGRYNDPPLFTCPKEDWKAKTSEHQEKLDKDLEDKGYDTWSKNTNEGTKGASAVEHYVYVDFERVATNIIKTESPIKNFDKEDACWIKSDPTQYYLRFGALLTYIKTNIIPKINTENPDHYRKPPMFNVNYQPYKNFMYVLPNSISLDPRVCIVRNDAFRKTSGDVEVFKNLQPFRAVDYGNLAEPNKAYIMNIYLNFNFIIESLNSNTDERGDISVFEFLKAICDGLNKSLGGINNLEPIINEENNTLEIIDTTPIPGINTGTQEYTLQLYGYEKTSNGYISNFVRKVDLKTAITPEYATMITVGATAGGYVKGTEATAFSRWNKGLTDRFKEKFLPANESSLEEGGEDEALTNYVQQFLSSNKIITCYGFSGTITADASTSTPIKGLKLSEDAISSNLSVVTEYYKWLIASQKNQQGGTIGFIPFKLSFTMNGLSGIKIYNKLHVDTRFLPKAYGSTVDLIVTGVSHKLQNNDWETDIEATLMPKTSTLEDAIISSNVINEGIQNEVNNIASNESYQPTSADDDLWIYLTWQQGLGGATQHYQVSTGKRKTYGIKAEAIKKNWPGNLQASNKVSKVNIDTLYKTDPKKLAIGFIDVWRQRYNTVTSRALTLINSSGKNRTGVLYSDIKKSFQKFAVPSKGLTWEKLARFGLIENSLNTDDETATTFQGMFQINKTYKKNPDYLTILTNSKKGIGHKPNYTEYDLDKYIGPLAPRISNLLASFKSNSGYPN